MNEVVELEKEVTIGITATDTSGNAIEVLRRQLEWSERLAKFEVTSEQLAPPLVADAHTDIPTQAGAGLGVKEGLAVAKFFWEVIKDNRPATAASGATTSVLGEGNTSPLAYSDARRFTGTTWEWWGKNVLDFDLFRIKYHVMGTCRAKPPGGVPQGDYLPSIYLSFSTCFAAIGWTLGGSAEVSTPSNIGGRNSVNPFLVLTAHLSAGSPLQSFSDSFFHDITGRKGETRSWN